ncbi:MAG: hypothetical protein LBH28_11575 [Oscillospiraceae bacterium]|jgi:hypothetical protein|nr:hypothetical protein [Oscillospiraceae bacterium]
MYDKLKMQEAHRKPARRPPILSYVAVNPGQEWDGYITFGENNVSSSSTANKNIIKMIILLTKGNTCLPRADCAGNARFR